MKIRFLISICIVVVTACSLPKDPADTFASAQNGELKVGIVNNPPFTQIESGAYSGIEVDLIRKFADSNNMEVSFEEGSESTLIQKLEDRSIFALIGGFDKRSVWLEKVGSTTEYDDEHLILLPQGENRLTFELEKVIYQMKEP